MKDLWKNIKLGIQNIIHSLGLDDSHDLRLIAFVGVYVLFSAIGAYNFAHLAAFLYIVWLLERKV